MENFVRLTISGNLYCVMPGEYRFRVESSNQAELSYAWFSKPVSSDVVLRKEVTLFIGYFQTLIIDPAFGWSN